MHVLHLHLPAIDRFGILKINPGARGTGTARSHSEAKRAGALVLPALEIGTIQPMWPGRVNFFTFLSADFYVRCLSGGCPVGAPWWLSVRSIRP